MAQAQVRLNRIFESLKRSKSPFYGVSKLVTRPIRAVTRPLMNDFLKYLGFSPSVSNFKTFSSKTERNVSSATDRRKTIIYNNTTVASSENKGLKTTLQNINKGLTRNRRILVKISRSINDLLKIFRRQSILGRLDREDEKEIERGSVISGSDRRGKGFSLGGLLRGGLIGLAAAVGALATRIFSIIKSSILKLFGGIFALANLKTLLKGLRFFGPLGLVATLANGIYEGITAAYDSFIKGEDARTIIDNFAEKFLNGISFGLIDSEVYENLKQKISDKLSALARFVYNEKDGKSFIFGQQLPTRDELAERVPKIVDGVVNDLGSVIVGFIESARRRVSGLLGDRIPDDTRDLSLSPAQIEEGISLPDRPMQRISPASRPSTLTMDQAIEESARIRRILKPITLEDIRKRLNLKISPTLPQTSRESRVPLTETPPTTEANKRLLSATDRRLQEKRSELKEIIDLLRDNYNTNLDEYTGKVNWIKTGARGSTRATESLYGVERQPFINEARTLIKEIDRLRTSVGPVTIPEQRKNGGPVSALTPYIVGERGRELFVPKMDGTVVNNNVTERIIGSSSDSQKLSAVSGSKSPSAVVYNDNRVTNNVMGGGGGQQAASGSSSSKYSPFNSLASRLSTRADRTLAPAGYTARTLA